MASRMGGSVEDKQLEVLKNIAKTNQETGLDPRDEDGYDD